MYLHKASAPPEHPSFARPSVSPSTLGGQDQTHQAPGKRHTKMLWYSTEVKQVRRRWTALGTKQPKGSDDLKPNSNNREGRQQRPWNLKGHTLRRPSHAPIAADGGRSHGSSRTEGSTTGGGATVGRHGPSLRQVTMGSASATTGINDFLTGTGTTTQSLPKPCPQLRDLTVVQ